MKKTRRRGRAALTPTLAAVALAMAQQALADPVAATWTGPANGSFAIGGHWDIGRVPLNGGGTGYSVRIGAGRSVAYGVDGAQAIDELLLNVGAALNVASPDPLFPTTALTVAGRALIAGSVNVANASFTALAAGTNFVGDVNAVSVTGGGVVRIAATAFSSKGAANRTMLYADGAGSLLDLSTVRTLDSGFVYAGCCSVRSNAVVASNGAAMDLSGVLNVVAPQGAVDALNFSASAGGSLRLASLQQVSGATPDTGKTRFSADQGTLVLGPLQRLNRVAVDLRNRSLASAGGDTGLAVITDSTFAASGGSRLDAATLVADFGARGLANTVLIAAAGKDTVLTLSGLQSIDSGFAYAGCCSNRTNTVAAADGALLDLSGVRRITAPAHGADTLAFEVGNGAVLRLDAVQTISGLTLDSGNTRFSADGGTLVLGPLRAANRMAVELRNASTMRVGGYDGVAAITNSTFAVSGGSKLDASSLKADYDVSGLYNRSVIDATGAGSKLDLSGLRTLDSGFAYLGCCSNRANSVNASKQAAIDLSGVSTIVAPSNAADSIAFNATSGGSIALSSLKRIGGATAGTGNTVFYADAGHLVLGPLQKVERMSVNLANGSTLRTGGAAGTGTLTDSTFSASGGSRLDAARWVADYDVRGLPNRTLLAAAGAGSVLDLSGLRSINAGFAAPGCCSTRASTIAATDQASIDLSGVTTIVGPDSRADALVLRASSGGSIRLAGLRSITSAGTGRVDFVASGGGQLLLHGLDAGPGVSFTLSDAGSALTVAGSLALQAGSTLSAGAGTTLAIAGSLSFAQVVESELRLEAATVLFTGTGLQSLEVGGTRTRVLQAGTPVLDGFAIGQLGVGRDGLATRLQLVDTIDNGNRASPEVLYLNGGSDGRGLRILGGSTLVLNGLDLYTSENGRWLHVNELFTNGRTVIAYDQGFIATSVPEPGTLALTLAGCAGLLLRRRSGWQADA